ncbi:MAG: Type 1 glutamine amidotransferase-like domain-containing protein [Oscillospiraceae bacterium]|nr:Type 1 glutamine amidotransferase-like domain-containing protein [Oscillospiraceae bacterium]
MSAAVYLIPGGHPPNFKQMTEDLGTALAACGKPHPAIAYVGTASGDNPLFFRLMKKQLTNAGAGAVTLAPLAGWRANPDAAKKILSEADGVFLSGGEVEDGIVALKKAGIDGLLTEMYHGGKPFFGVSAGCIMMGAHWVHWDAENDDSTASLFDCLHFVPLTFDTHCENEGWKELKCALRLMGDGAAGYGLSTGGFYTADGEGHLTSARNTPAVFHNSGGKIDAVAWHG